MKFEPREQVIYKIQPDSNIRWLWFLKKCPYFALIGAFICFWGFGFFGGMFCTFSGDSCENFSQVIAIGIVSALLVALSTFVLSLIYFNFLYKTYTYYITDQRCIFQGGILRKVQRSVPYHKITDVEISQNILERILGISTINLFTPGTSSVKGWGYFSQEAEISFEGLKDSATPASTINQILSNENRNF